MTDEWRCTMPEALPDTRRDTIMEGNMDEKGWTWIVAGFVLISLVIIGFVQQRYDGKAK